MTDVTVPSSTSVPVRSGRWLFLNTLALLALFWGAAAMELYEDRDSRIAEKVTDLDNLAELFSKYAEERFNIVELSLSGIAGSLRAEDMTDPARALRLHEILKSTRTFTKGVTQFLLIDETGVVRHSSETATPEQRLIVPPAVLEARRADAPGSSAIYATNVGTYGATLGRHFIIVSRRLERADGSFGGTVAASMLLDDLSALYRAVDLGPGGRAGLFHLDGTLMLIGPTDDDTVGKNYSDSPELRGMFARPDAGVLRPEAGAERYVSYRRVARTPTISFVTTPTDTVLAPWREELRRVVATDGGLSLLVLVMVLIAHRARLRRESEATANMAALAHREEDTRRAAAEAQTARDRLAQVLSAMAEGVAVLDADNRYTFVNDAFCRLCVLPRERFVGRRLDEVLPPAKLDKYGAYFQAGRDNAEGALFQDSFTAGDGLERWVEILAMPTGENVSLFVRDLSQRREAEQRVMLAQRMEAVGSLSGGLAHDFNNILAVVLGNVELMQTKLSGHAAARHARTIELAAERGSALVSRLLAFARRQPLMPEALDVRAACAEACELAAVSMPANIGVAVTAPDDLWPVLADPAQLENALVNLCLNARDAMSAGGQILIAASNSPNGGVQGQDGVCIAVTDSGVGMPPDVLARAFDPFFTTKPKGLGSGLGLSMVAAFAEQSGGRVGIDSIKGKGTTVRVILPRAISGAPPPPTRGNVAPDPRGTEDILLVEDNTEVREYVTETLTGLGYTVFPYADADTALAECAAGLRPDLLFTDVMLAGPMDGRQMAELMMQRGHVSRVLYMTAYNETLASEPGAAGRDYQLILKPFSRRSLAVKLRAVLELRAAD